MANDRSELDDLRRLDALEARAKASPPTPDNPYSLTNLAGAAIEPNLQMLSGAVATPLAGYAGMAGAALPGEAGQGARWTQAVQHALTYSPITQGGQTAAGAISYPFRKYGEGTNWLGEKAAEMTGSPAAGAAVNAGLQVGGPMLAAKLLSLANASDTAPGAAGRWLMQKALKPSPADFKSGAAQRALSTAMDEGFIPTAGGIEDLSSQVGNLDDQAANVIANARAKVKVAPVIAGARQMVSPGAVNQVNPRSDMAAVASGLDEFRNSPLIAGQDTIPVQVAHQLKRGTYQSLGDKAYGELGSKGIETQKALANQLREATLQGAPEVAPILQREGALMNLKDVAEKRAYTAANANPAGLSALRLDNPLSAIGFWADRSTYLKALAAHLLYGAGDPNIARLGIGSAAVNQGQEQQ